MKPIDCERLSFFFFLTILHARAPLSHESGGEFHSLPRDEEVCAKDAKAG